MNENRPATRLQRLMARCFMLGIGSLIAGALCFAINLPVGAAFAGMFGGIFFSVAVFALLASIVRGERKV